MLHHLSHGGERGVADHPKIQILPDLIESPEPVEQLQILHLRQVPGKTLVEMVMGIDKTRVAEHPGAVDDLIGGSAEPGAHGADEAVVTEDVCVLPEAVAVVTGDDGADVFQQQGCHETSLLS